MKVDFKNNFNIALKNKYSNTDVQYLSFTSIRNIPITDQLIRENVNYIPLITLLQKLGNAFSKEDFNQINKQVSSLLKHYNKDNIAELMRVIEIKSQELLTLINDSGIRSKTEDGIIQYADKVDKISIPTRKKIKSVRMQQIAVRETLKEYNPHTKLTNAPTIGDWFGGFKKIPQLPISVNSLFEHPIDRALFLVGQFTENELKLINKKTLVLRQVSTDKLLKQKIELLNKLTLILIKTNQDFYGAFTNNELTKINNLLINYSSFDKELIQRGIYSKDIEVVLFNSNNKLSYRKIGENINGYGLVVRKASTYDRELKQECPTLIVFSNVSSKKTIKKIKIDEEFESEVAKFKEDYEVFCNSVSINDNDLQAKMLSFNEKAKAIMEKEKKLVISEISFSMLNKKLAEVFISEIPKPLKNDEILKVIDNKDVFPLIIDYINHDSQRYPNGARDVAASLLHLLFKNDCNSIFVKALAINSSRSPVGMYLRFGFEPVSHDKEKIREIIVKSANGFDYKEPVWMYLPPNSMLEAIVKKEEPLKEIFELSHNGL